jgi:hypothetical protein
LLFMIVAKHTAEMCPGGIVLPDREFLAKLGESLKKSGVKEIMGYSDAPSHVYYFVLETDDNVSLNNAVEPLRLIGEVAIHPILKLTELSDWAKKIGIQK